MENKNSKKGFSLLEMIIVVIISGIIYRTVSDNVANTLDSSRKIAFLSKIENSSSLVCNAYKSDESVYLDRGEYFNQYSTTQPTFHNSNYDVIDPTRYEELENSIVIETPQGYTDPANSSSIVYKYRNGECLTEVYLSKLLYQSDNLIKNTFKTNVVDNGSNWLVTFITFDGNNDNHKSKHLMNVRDNTYRDRRDEGTFNTTSLSGQDIQNMTGFVRNKTPAETSFLTADDFNEVNNGSSSNSYLGLNRVDDAYDVNLNKPVRFNNNAHPLSKDGISPLRYKENNLKVKASITNINKNGYMNSRNDGHIPGGRGFITCKQNRTCIDNIVTPTVDNVGIKVVRP